MTKLDRREGLLTRIEPTETLLISGKEVHRRLFHVQGEPRAIAAVSDEGTAYYSLQHDKRFEPDTPVRYYMAGGLCLAIRIATAEDSKQRDPETDIETLKDIAATNLMLSIGELHALFAQFPAESPQAYAIALQLRRQHRDKSLPIGDYDAVCSQCKRTLTVSPRHAYRIGTAHCAQCETYKAFDLVVPLPSEAKPPPPSLEDLQERLKRRFGDTENNAEKS